MDWNAHERLLQARATYGIEVQKKEQDKTIDKSAGDGTQHTLSIQPVLGGDYIYIYVNANLSLSIYIYMYAYLRKTIRKQR